MPKVYNWRSDKLPTRVKYVGRPSKWGNPFRDGTREENIQRFRDSLTLEKKRQIQRDLRGKDLACWCAPLPCHADILLEIANGPSIPDED
jgi:hypothetical protein